jgi:hypothetical protein
MTTIGKIILFACLSVAAPSQAAEYFTAVAGGTGGESFGKRCEADKVLVGLRGLAGNFVDSIEVICAQIDRAGHWVAVIPHLYPSRPGLAPFDLRCPQHHAVSGIVGQASALVDKLRIYCGPLGAEGALGSVGSMLAGSIGGNGGTPFGPFHCVDGKPAAGIGGRSGVYLDQIYLVCNTPQPLRLIKGGFERNLPGLTTIGVNDTFSVQTSVPASGALSIALRSAHPAIATAPSSIPFGIGTFGKGAAIRGVAPGCTTITASFAGDAYSAPIMVDGVSTNALSLTLSRRASTASSGPIVATVTLPSPAPAAGLPIALSSSHPSAINIPSSVVVAPGSRTSTFDIGNVNLTGADVCVVMTATGNGGTEKRTAVLGPTSIVPRVRPRIPGT